MSAPATPQYEPDRLDDALDALFAGRQEPLDELDPGAADVMGQLQAWAELGGLEHLAGWLDPQPSQASVTSNALISKGHPMSITNPAAMPAAGMRSPMPHRGRIPLPSPLSVVSWLVIVAIMASAVWGVGNRLIDRDPAPTMSAYQPAASPEPTAQNAEVNYGGDAGHSWYLGDTTPVIGDQPVAFRIDDQRRDVITPPLVVGDTMIVTTMDATSSDANYQTIRYNLATREVMWIATIPLLGPLATDGTYVYGNALDSMSERGLYTPVVIRLDTGESHSGLADWLGSKGIPEGPVAVNGVGYYVSTDGVAANIPPRDELNLWTSTHPPASVTLNPMIEPGYVNDRSYTGIVAGDDAVFVVRPSKTIVKLDPETGEELASINLVDTLRGDVRDVDLQISGQRLVVTAYHANRPAGSDATPASILVYHTANLSFLVRGDVTDLRSNLTIDLNWIHFAAQLPGEDQVRIYRMHPSSGAFSAPISDFALPAYGSAALSLSGSTLMVVGPPSTYAFIDVEQESVIQSGEVQLQDDEWLMAFPIQLWNNVPVAVTDLGTVILFGESPDP